MPSYEIQLRNIRSAAKILDELKMATGCADCGFNAWPEALHFDHTDPASKQHSLGWVPDRSRLKSRAKLQRFLEHVERYCVIRCANCHAHRSKQDKHHLMGRSDHGGSTQQHSTLF